MKRKLFFLICLVLLLFSGNMAVTAALEPNQYEKKDIKLNTKNLQDNQSVNENKKPLPELQKNLTFDGKTRVRHDGLKDQLFTADEEQNNTIIAKTTKLGMFTSTERNYTSWDDGYQSSSSIWNFQMILIILITVTVLLLFLFVLPKLAKSNQ
ncbi:MAG: type VII secretion protein EssA [Bacillus sp. (in: firmicutes)]